MKNHTIFGAEMLLGLRGDFGVIARNICAFHHEQYCGKGYWGVYTDSLPLYVQIASVCDVGVALLHKRIYKPAWPPDDVFDYIKAESGKQFNPMLVEIFLSLMYEQDIGDILKPRQALNGASFG
jgi:putative two-component system response regulator